MDVDALGQLTQSYMRQGLEQEMDHLPRVKGAAVIFDDANERIFPVQLRYEVHLARRRQSDSHFREERIFCQEFGKVGRIYLNRCNTYTLS